MAREIVTKVIDDYTQEEIDGDPISTDLTIDDQHYPLDLSKTSREKLAEMLEPFLRHVSPSKVGRQRTSASAGARSATKVDREQNRAMREWWRQAHAAGMKLPNGNPVPTPGEKGRIPAAIESLYHSTGGKVTGESTETPPETPETPETPEPAEAAPPPKKATKRGAKKEKVAAEFSG